MQLQQRSSAEGKESKETSLLSQPCNSKEEQPSREMMSKEAARKETNLGDKVAAKDEKFGAFGNVIEKKEFL